MCFFLNYVQNIYWIIRKDIKSKCQLSLVTYLFVGDCRWGGLFKESATKSITKGISAFLFSQ